MALNDQQHVEAVAMLRDLLERPAGVPIPSALRNGIEGWLTENHPPPGAYINAARGLAALAPKPLIVTSMAATHDPDSTGTLLTLTSGIEDGRRDWPFKLGSTDGDALGCALRALRGRGGKDTDRIRAERDSLSQALVILGEQR